MSRRSELRNAVFGNAEIHEIEARDGEKITAYLTHPSSGRGATAPLIVMPHGGPEGRDFFDFDPDVQILATRGYRVLQVNFRASSGYGREFAKSGYGQWGGIMQYDVTDAVKHFQAAGYATPAKTCIFGYSYGGYVALQRAVATPELYNCIVSGAGDSDLLQSLRALSTDRRNTLIFIGKMECNYDTTTADIFYKRTEG